MDCPINTTEEFILGIKGLIFLYSMRISRKGSYICPEFIGISFLPSGHTTSKQRRFKVDSTPWRRINIESTLFKRCVPIGYCLRIK